MSGLLTRLAQQSLGQPQKQVSFKERPVFISELAQEETATIEGGTSPNPMVNRPDESIEPQSVESARINQSAKSTIENNFSLQGRQKAPLKNPAENTLTKNQGATESGRAQIKSTNAKQQGHVQPIVPQSGFPVPAKELQNILEQTQDSLNKQMDNLPILSEYTLKTKPIHNPTIKPQATTSERLLKDPSLPVAPLKASTHGGSKRNVSNEIKPSTKLHGELDSVTQDTVINVTIGKIEVKAVNETIKKPPPTKSPSQHKPMMSLDEYQAKRSRGER